MSARRPFFAAKADYEAVACMLRDTLILVRDEGTHIFLALPAFLHKRLSINERKWIAWTVLVSLPAMYARDVIERVLSAEEREGPPLAPFLEVEEEANDWAARASLQELWAYGRAILIQLSPKLRRALWRIVGGTPEP